MDGSTGAGLEHRIRAIASEANGLLDTAQGCRAGNMTALQCAPVLYTLFPTSTAAVLGGVLVEVWACELSSDNLSTALTSCRNAAGQAAFTSAEITSAVTASMSLKFLDVAHVPTTYGGAENSQLRMMSLSQGDLVTIRQSEHARFLLFSCLPGDYTPTPGSLIAALQQAYGIDVASLAANPAADYRSTHHCWISQPMTSVTSHPIPYQQLLCFESTGADAVQNIPGVFASIKEYIPDPPPLPNTGPTIISALLSTGGAGANKSQVLTALFDGCWGLLTTGAGYNMTCFRIDIYSPSWEAELTQLFDQLKTQHHIGTTTAS